MGLLGGRLAMMRRRGRAFLLPLLLAGAARPARAADRARFVLDPARTTITFQLPAFLHTVHGKMPLKAGTLELDPVSGDASGEVVVDVSAAETGNASRDRRMHREVLESARYPDASLLFDRVVGAIRFNGDSTVEVSGRLRLHGAEHPITLRTEIHVADGEATVQCRFEIPYVAWGLKDPSTALLHVADRVTVAIRAAGRVQTPR